MTQQLYVLVFIIEILRFMFIQKPIHEYLLLPLNGNNPDILQWMIKQTTICPSYGILLSSKKEWTVGTCNNLDESPENYAEWENPIS